ncbi:MAG: HTTM domain-containing protein [Deltaproteobacteria bacterium]|nr:HTTM domain-containing protein [Deltaproteobacteria bacterium]
MTSKREITSPTSRAMRALARWAFDPQPIVRLEVIRMLAPLAILGFMAARLAHPDDWLSSAGFRVPPLDDDWRQPLSVPPLSPAAARAVCAVLLASGLAVSAGAFTRVTAFVFAVALAYVALADRPSAFTVSKLGPVIALALALSPAGARFSVDAWLRRRRRPDLPLPDLCSGGNVRFFQLLLPVFYFSSGICKARGAWLDEPYVLWTHLHSSYQTGVSRFAAEHVPAVGWTIMQALTLAFECGAPLWFALRFTRGGALAYGVAMHAAIGMLFGPVAYFSMLMIVILLASYAPIHWLSPSFGRRRSR